MVVQPLGGSVATQLCLYRAPDLRFPLYYVAAMAALLDRNCLAHSKSDQQRYWCVPVSGVGAVLCALDEPDTGRRVLG